MAQQAVIILAVDLREQPASAEETLDGELGPSTAPRSQSQRELRRSDEVGRYVILERVGAGGMGVVYAAWDPKLDRKVALKLLHGEQQSHGQRLEREAQAMARLAHPNVITVHDVGEVEGRVFVAMEFVEGETLGSWARLAGGRGASDPRPEPEPEPEPRRWSEILEVLLAAGRGLAAAHAQGLIHRDFKPDNVMIGADGRVRVMDFGLVRETHAASVPRTPTARTKVLEALSLDSPSALESQLTMAGSLLGTPAYMAPEQLRGDEADARADQFSFCVAAWQCLYGVRPFTGDSPLAVLFAITHAKFSEPPSTSRIVPTRLRRALERGLASDPAARWPDMPQLLAALANATASTRRPRLVGIASLGLAAAAATAAIWVQSPPPPSPCEHAGDELRALWTPERRASLELEFRSSALVYADATWDRVGVALDDWGAEFVGTRRATCEDSEIRHEQSAELLDLRMACLDQRLARFAALVELFAAADDTVIEKAVEAVEALPKLEVCSDRSWLTATVRPPEDPALAAAVAELREGLAKVGVMTDAGKAVEVVELATATEANAAELGWTPLVAEASLQLGRVRQEIGEFAEARAALERAFFAARRSGHDEVAAEAGFRLVYGLSLGLGQFEAAAGWIDHALAEAERIGRSDLLAEVHAAIGIHHYVKSENELAAKAFARALELLAGSPPSSSLASAHINYGTILARVDQGQRERAFAELDLGLNMLEQALGAQHPSVALALSNKATVHGTYNQRREAIALLERALAINRGALGHEHPMTALVELNLSNNLIESDEREDLQRALELAERSAASHREIFAQQHGMVAQSELAIGRALRLLGRPDQAITHVDAAFAIWSATLGETNRDTDHARLIRARCDVDLGEPVEARAKLELILSHEPDAKVLNQARLDLAELIANDDPGGAAALLEQARSYFEETGDDRRNQRIAALGRALDHPRLR